MGPVEASLRPLAALLIAAALTAACGGKPPVAPDPIPGPTPSPSPSPSPGPSPGPPPAGSPVFVGAGDIGLCNSTTPQATAALIDGIAGEVFTLGDNAYESGTKADFQNCYDPSWARHKSRTHPSPGNHDYGTAGAAPYFEYFGASAGPSGLGYYSFHVGEWLVISLNSNIPATTGSAQGAWLQQTLAANTARCTVAYWHHPRFTSGGHGPTTAMGDAWRMLYQAGAELVLSGHDHMYEVLKPMNANGDADAKGVRQIIAGTGGAALEPAPGVAPNSQTRINQHGVLKLTLGPESYAWEFIGISGATDSGFDLCHGAP